MKKKTIGIWLAFGDIYLNAGVHPLKEPLDDSILRFDAVVSRMKELGHPGIIFATAGYSKSDPFSRQPNRVVSLSEQLRRFIWKHRRKISFPIMSSALCWSTENEIRVALEEAMCFKHIRNADEIHVVIASHWWHKPRVWMYTQMHAPAKLKVHLVNINGGVSSWSTFVHEILAILRDFPRFINKISDTEPIRVS